MIPRASARPPGVAVPACTAPQFALALRDPNPRPSQPGSRPLPCSSFPAPPCACGRTRDSIDLANRLRAAFADAMRASPPLWSTAVQATSRISSAPPPGNRQSASRQFPTSHHSRPSTGHGPVFCGSDTACMLPPPPLDPDDRDIHPPLPLAARNLLPVACREDRGQQANDVCDIHREAARIPTRILEA